MLRSVLLIVSLISWNIYGFGKTINIDSLRNVLNTTEGVEQIEVYNLLTKIYFRRNLDSTDYFNQKAIHLAQKHVTKKEYKKVFRDAKALQVKVNSNRGVFGKADSLANLLLPICLAANDTTNLLLLYNQKYLINYLSQGSDSALYFLQQGLHFSYNNPKSEAQIYGNMAIAYREQTNIPKAIKLFFKSLEAYQKLGNKYGESLVYSNIGVTYIDQYQFEKAIKYLKKGITISKEIENLADLTWLYGVLGECYKDLEEYDKAFTNHQKALALAEEIQDIPSVFFQKSVIANLYLLHGLTDSTYQLALQLTDEVEQMDVHIENVSNYYYYINKAIIYNRAGSISSAIEYAEKAYETVKKSNKTSTMILATEQLANFYQKMANYKKAYEYHVIFKTLSDSFGNDRNLAAIEIQEAEHQFKLEKAQQAQQLEKVKSSLRLRTIIGMAALLILILVSTIAVILRRANRLKTQQNEILEQKVTERTKELEQANYELRTFNYIASHDIKEPIRNIGSHAGLIYRKLPMDLKEKLGDYFNTIKTSTQQLYTLIEDFARYTSLSKDEKIDLLPVELNALTTTITKTLDDTITKYNGRVVYKNLPTIQSSSSLLFTILKNIIENGLKYNKSIVPTIHISYEITEQYHQINISDNGIGIEIQYHDKIFEMFKRLHNRSEYDGSGIGLAIVKLCMDKLGGKVIVNSKLGEGTVFSLQLPN